MRQTQDEEPATGCLWIVATPIGSIDDLAPRAREVLARVDLILAEDTRRTRALLSHTGIPSQGRLRSLHEHNEEKMTSKVLESLRRGESVALLSDAGTPVLSDPGFLLVRAVREERMDILSVPGASAYTAALASSGQPPLPATLAGFLPPRGGARRRRIAELNATPWTLVVLLSPHRLGRELADLAEILGGDRNATLLAELSKLHERATMAPLAELAQCNEVRHPRGEYVLVIGPASPAAARVEASPVQIRRVYCEALARGLSRKEALRHTGDTLGISRRDAYQVLHVDEKE